MHIGVLLLTHDDFAHQLVDAQQSPDIESVLPLRAMAIHDEMGASVLSHHLSLKIRELDQGAGVLVLCDQVSDALSLALSEAARETLIMVVAGLNHAMFMAVLNEPDHDLAAQTQAAVKAGKAAIREFSMPLPD